MMNIGRLHKLFEFIISNLRVTIMLNLFALFGGEVASIYQIITTLHFLE